ncbi:MAG: cytochrome c biogenesis protein CcsA [Gammaproteobacteria bacterium]|nr:cytochrome c biogenesis protein CcsA [Gammaproteobacteria bacterium]
MSDITIFLLYILAAAAFGSSRLPRFDHQSRPLFLAASILVAIGITLHSQTLYAQMLAANGLNLSLGNAASLIGLELALIGLIAAVQPPLRGISAGLLILGALAASLTGLETAPESVAALAWQIRLHVLVSLMSYGLLTVGAIVAVYALIQERRLRAGRLSTFSHLFAPLETTEKLLFAIAAAGFAGLAIAILSGLTFVEDLFAQHLVHKTTFSLLAFCVFGALLAGRFFKGWRGAGAIRLYLGGFLLLCLAYFGTRVILEQFLGRSWG